MAGMAKGKARMLTVKDVAQRFEVADGVVRGWCIAGYFPGAKKEKTPLGEYWQIPESDLQGFEKRKPGRPPKPKLEPISEPKARRRKAQ
jgi:hypothetical protein